MLADLELIPTQLREPMPLPQLEHQVSLLFRFDNPHGPLRATLGEVRRIAAAVRDRLSLDIGGVTLEQFMRKTGVKATVLHKIDTKFANKLLWRNCLLKNYVEDYVQNPLTQSFESLPLPA